MKQTPGIAAKITGDENFKYQRNKKETIISICIECNEDIIDIKPRKCCNSTCDKNHKRKIKRKIKNIEIEKGECNYNKSLRKYKLEIDGHICQICNSTEWNGKEIPLVLDHIDGNPYNNFPINLRMICPNCDAQTDTYKGKNKGNGRHERMIRYYNNQSY